MVWSQRIAPVAVLLLATACPSAPDDDGAASMDSGPTSGPTSGPGQTSTSSASGSGPSSASTPASSTALPTSGSTGADSTDTGLIMNECGTFDPNVPGDAVPPQDPADPEIVTACTALCEVLATVPDCRTDPTTCLDNCRMRSCTICPGTLAPLVDCETEAFDAMACMCGPEGATCPIPKQCAELEAETGFCGG